jgi:hypothetical protein
MFENESESKLGMNPFGAGDVRGDEEQASPGHDSLSLSFLLLLLLLALGQDASIMRMPLPCSYDIVIDRLLKTPL